MLKDGIRTCNMGIHLHWVCVTDLDHVRLLYHFTSSHFLSWKTTNRVLAHATSAGQHVLLPLRTALLCTSLQPHVVQMHMIHISVSLTLEVPAESVIFILGFDSQAVMINESAQASKAIV